MLQGETVIIGGGIGGLALGVALQQAGLGAIVLERAPVLREIGAGLLLTPNATWVLRRLGLLDHCIQRGRVLRGWRILDHKARVLQTYMSGSVEAPAISIARSCLQQILMDALAPGTLRLNHEATALEADRSNDAMGIRFCDGPPTEAQAVVVAAGGKSELRRDYFAQAAPRPRRYLGWRALVRGVPPGWKDGFVTESWARGCRFGIAPVDDERCYWYATENVARPVTLPTRPWRDHLQRLFHGWHDPVQQLIAATSEDEILRTEIADHPPLWRWHRGKAALLGDAAHLMTPNLGQGAAMALEDAWACAIALCEGDRAESAFASFERKRRGRVAMVGWLSRLVGGMIQLEQPLLWRARNLGLRLTPDFLGQRVLSPVFDFRI